MASSICRMPSSLRCPFTSVISCYVQNNFVKFVALLQGLSSACGLEKLRGLLKDVELENSGG